MEKFAEIEKYEDRLLKAIRENNVKELEILLHDDLVFLNPMGQVLTKDMDLENYKSGQIAIETLQPSEQRVSLIGDTAVITVKIRLKGKYLEHMLDENFQYLRVWIQQEGGWKVIAGSAARI